MNWKQKWTCAGLALLAVAVLSGCSGIGAAIPVSPAMFLWHKNPPQPPSWEGVTNPAPAQMLAQAR